MEWWKDPWDGQTERDKAFTPTKRGASQTTERRSYWGGMQGTWKASWWLPSRLRANVRFRSSKLKGCSPTTASYVRTVHAQCLSTQRVTKKDASSLDSLENKVNTVVLCRDPLARWFFCHAEQDVIRSIYVDESLPRDLEESELPQIFSRVAYGLSDNRTHLIVQTRETHRGSSSQTVLRNRIKVFNVFAIAQYVANNDPSFRRETSIEEYIQQ